MRKERTEKEWLTGQLSPQERFNQGVGCVVKGAIATGVGLLLLKGCKNMDKEPVVPRRQRAVASASPDGKVGPSVVDRLEARRDSEEIIER